MSPDNSQDPSEDAKALAQPGEVETIGERHGMFGVSGTGDTSGYGGLVAQTVLPAPSRRPGKLMLPPRRRGRLAMDQQAARRLRFASRPSAGL